MRGDGTRVFAHVTSGSKERQRGARARLCFSVRYFVYLWFKVHNCSPSVNLCFQMLEEKERERENTKQIFKEFESKRRIVGLGSERWGRRGRV